MFERSNKIVPPPKKLLGLEYVSPAWGKRKQVGDRPGVDMVWSRPEWLWCIGSEFLLGISKSAISTSSAWWQCQSKRLMEKYVNREFQDFSDY